MNLPVHTLATSQQLILSNGSAHNAHAQANTPQGMFAGLLDLLGGSTPLGQIVGAVQSAGRVLNDNTGSAPTQTANAFINLNLGELGFEIDTSDPKAALAALADVLGFELPAGLDQPEELNPDAPLAGLGATLSDLLNTLANKIESIAPASGSAPDELLQQAQDVLQFARALLRQQPKAGAPMEIQGTGNLDSPPPELQQIANQLRSARADGTNAPTQSATTASEADLPALAAQLRAVAADVDLVRQNIPIPSARADAAAIFNGPAPSLDDLLNPGQQQAPNSTSQQAPADHTRLADKLGANMAARADATVNQPAPGNNPTQTLASALAEAGLNTKMAVQTPAQTQVDPLPSASVTQSGAPTLSADISAAARPMQAAYQPPQINIPQLAFHIASQFQAGNSRFQIRMDPPELGRIDVRMDVDAHGAVHARLVVDRAETLEMLRHDSRTLERALQQTGLDQSKTTLEFSLRQQNSGGEQNSGQQPAAGQNTQSGISVEDALPIAANLQAYQGLASPGGLNLWV